MNWHGSSHPAEHWQAVISAYEDFLTTANGGYLGPMLSLVQGLAANPASNRLFPSTSHETLWMRRRPAEPQSSVGVNLSPRTNHFEVMFQDLDNDFTRTGSSKGIDTHR
jgi:hypothetical protein